MTRHSFAAWLAIAAVFGGALSSTSLGAADRASADQQGTTAKTPPDISGIWIAGFVPRLNPNPPLLPAAEKIWKSRNPKDDPMARCLPPGIPRLTSTAFPIEIVQMPKQVTILYEYDHFVRRIYTDGRKQPDDPDPSWLGHSVGHWEGNTLVVDTIALHGDQFWLDETGLPADENLHVTERYTPSADGQSLRHDITIEDPTVYSAPWQSSKTYRRRPGLQIMEFVCETK